MGLSLLWKLYLKRLRCEEAMSRFPNSVPRLGCRRRCLRPSVLLSASPVLMTGARCSMTSRRNLQQELPNRQGLRRGLNLFCLLRMRMMVSRRLRPVAAMASLDVDLHHRRKAASPSSRGCMHQESPMLIRLKKMLLRPRQRSISAQALLRQHPLLRRVLLPTTPVPILGQPEPNTVGHKSPWHRVSLPVIQ